MQDVIFNAAALPSGTYPVKEIQTAIRNFVLDKIDRLPRRSGKRILKTDEISLLDGIASHLLRLLLIPAAASGGSAADPDGKVSLWYCGELIDFSPEGVLEVNGDERPHLNDFLFLDVLPDTPSTLFDDLKVDDAFAHTGSVVRNNMLCVNPLEWSVRNRPLISLDSFDEYVVQSGFPSRFDFEFEEASEAWSRVSRYSGGTLVYSSEQARRPGEFRPPCIIAKFMQKEFNKICGVDQHGRARTEAAAKAYLAEFRKLEPKDYRTFNRSVALEIKVAGYNLFETISESGFKKAWDCFREKLTDEERQALPGPGRPPKRSSQ